MDIFDRLGDLIRTILDDDVSSDGPPDSLPETSPYRGDPDMSQAWRELEDYLDEPEPSTKHESNPSFGSESSGVPDSLRVDFSNLEVPFAAPLHDVRRSYKRLMTAFHPDRHSSDPDRFRTATEVTKKLNQSLDRIRSHYEPER